jgi:SAM-dependent methyltransferase
MTVSKFRADSIGFERKSSIISMLSDDEQALYYNTAKTYRREGRVIEIGPWLGSGTFQICRGLEETGLPWSMTVVDRFRWNDLYASRYPTISLRPGEEFLSLFRANLGGYADKLTAIETELDNFAERLPMNEGIELLYVDAPKSWSMLWSVLNHVGPHLLPGARLVFQDFLHITSRQLIWLLSSTPQLRIDTIVEAGTAAAFVADGPIADLEATTPRSISALTADDLMGMWRRVREALPEERSGALAAGMALDLLQINAPDAARQVLDEGAVGKPWTDQVISDTQRQLRFSDKKNRTSLLEVVAYLRAGIHPRDVRAAVLADARDTARAAGATAEDALQKMPLDAAIEATAALREPLSGPALTLRFGLQAPLDRRSYLRLLPIFDSAARSGAAVWPLEIADLVNGRDVVELNAGVTLHGAVFRALGARSYTGVDALYDPSHRTYSSAVPGARLKAKHTLADVSAQIPNLNYAADSEALPRASADVVLVHGQKTVGELGESLSEARRLLRPGGTLWLRWRNPFSWSGHGQAPRRVADIDSANPNHKAVADWRHIRSLSTEVPTLAEIRRLVQARFSTAEWTSQIDDPAVILRMKANARDAFPGLATEDLVTASVTAVARA